MKLTSHMYDKLKSVFSKEPNYIWCVKCAKLVPKRETKETSARNIHEVCNGNVLTDEETILTVAKNIMPELLDRTWYLEQESFCADAEMGLAKQSHEKNQAETESLKKEIENLKAAIEAEKQAG